MVFGVWIETIHETPTIISTINRRPTMMPDTSPGVTQSVKNVSSSNGAFVTEVEVTAVVVAVVTAVVTAVAVVETNDTNVSVLLDMIAGIPIHDESRDIEKRLSSLIIKVGDKNLPTMQNNLDALSVVLEKDYVKHEATVMKTIRQCILELPWKVTVYATLVGLLNAKNNETGKRVVTMMHSVLTKSLAEGDWASVKVLMRFFTLLVNTNAIAPSTLVGMLDAFLQPALEDAGSGVVVSAKNNCFVYIVMSSLLWAGGALKERAPADLERISAAVAKYAEKLSEASQDNTITTVLHDAPPKGTNVIPYLLDVLQAVASTNWEVDVVVAAYEPFLNDFSSATAHDLPLLEIPVGLALPAYYTPSQLAQLVPSPAEKAVNKYILQDFISDTVMQLEGNRKDCAKYLMQIHDLCNEGVVTTITSLPSPDEADPQSALVFEYLISEVLFSFLLQLPTGLYREMYYTSLAIELRKAEPQIYPAVFGTTVENVFARLPNMDIESLNRLSNWLAVYISNFGFQWDWEKWEGVAEEPEGSPKRCFLEETLLKIIRLSYLDRVKELLPESYQALIPAKVPTQNFKFTVQAMDERTRAVSVAVGRCLKSKGTADQALAILDEHYSQWTDIDDSERRSLAREMLVEHVLLLGSKTFSHMLSAIERFLPALQKFGDSPEAKLQIAKVTEDFWLRNHQFFAITIDKLFNYRVIDPVTIVELVFDPSHVSKWSRFHYWEILQNTVNKLNIRIAQLQDRLEAARQPTATADDLAGDAMVDTEAVAQIEASLAQMVQEQRDVVVLAIQRFVQLLGSAEGTASVLDRAWLMSRFKEFVRSYRFQVVEAAATLENIVFTPDVSDELRKVYTDVRAITL
ncbi:Nuclear cap-binding protein subunit 1 [Linderina macrospora]|uniref:Nuclear cap-binding protein subunit 1 n=1 Tax=Linderina macrospora TaxID=4868 RepID=A0ACC1JED0_9FUNG|nr:Nuclear cap-binding protein subunit 1 [Linderina macrospora]